MRQIAFALMIAVPLAGMATAPAPVAAQNAASLLVSSTPAKDASGTAPVCEVTLAFAAKVELFSVTITPPEGEAITLYETDYAPGTPKLTGKDFRFPLPEPLRQPGSYSISYLLQTKGIRSLNGFISFTIEAKYPAPRVVATTPGAGDEVSAPLNELSLELESAVDLVMFDLQRIEAIGDDVATTTVQSFIDDQTPESSIRNAASFTFALTQPVTTPGDYSIVYRYTVTNPDGSQSAITDQANFTVR